MWICGISQTPLYFDLWTFIESPVKLDLYALTEVPYIWFCRHSQRSLTLNLWAFTEILVHKPQLFSLTQRRFISIQLFNLNVCYMFRFYLGLPQACQYKNLTNEDAITI